MANGIKVSKYDAAGEYGATQINQASHPQTITYHTVDGSTLGTVYVGGTGGTPTNTTPKTIQVHFKEADGTAHSDGFIVRQRGRKQFDVQSAGTGASSLTRCTIVEGSSLSAKQMYITFGYQGQGAQYAFRISNRYVWTNASAPVRYAYVLGASAAVSYHQGTADTYFKNSAGGDEGLFAVVEGA
jgi:ribosomal protein L27